MRSDPPAPSLDHGFERDHYLSTDWFQRENDVLFMRNWVYVGHESQVAAPGDRLTIELAGESLVITRDRSGVLHALFNVCRHRGARVCDPGAASGTRLICPYHRWSYELDGRLAKAPYMTDLLEPGRWDLRRASGIESWNGLIFVNLFGDEPTPLADVLSDRARWFGAYALAEARIGASVTYEVEANWKVVLENFFECYHCAANHPEFCQVFDLPAFFEGVPTDLEARGTGIDWFPLRAGAQSLTADGNFVCRKLLVNAADDGTLPADSQSVARASAVVWPGAVVGAFPDYAIVFAFRPLAPTRTLVHCDWLVAGDAIEGEDYERTELVHLWDVTNRQDWALCERAQQGINSRVYLPGPRNPTREPFVEGFTRTYWEMLAAV